MKKYMKKNMLLSSHPVMSNSLWPPWTAVRRPPCPSPSPEVCPSSCPLHQCWHPAISSSDVLFSFCPQSFPATGTFPVSQLFTWDNQNTEISASTSVPPMNVWDWFSLGLTGLIPLQFTGLQESYPAPQFKGINYSALCLCMFQLSQPYVTTGKITALTIRIFVSRVTSLLFNTLSRFVIASLPISNRHLISQLQSPYAVILEPRRGNLSLLPPFPSICHEVIGANAMILVF